MLTVQTIGSVKKNLIGRDTIVVTKVRMSGTLLDSSQVSPSNPVASRTYFRRQCKTTLGRLSCVNQKPTKIAPRAIDPKKKTQALTSLVVSPNYGRVRFTYQPSVEVDMYTPIVGPRAIPTIDPLIQRSMAQILCRTSHRSSIDPDPTTVGRADRKPQPNRPMMTAANESPSPTMAQKTA